MTKALDKRNEHLRTLAGDEPYNKFITVTEKACPYCDEFLGSLYVDGGYKCSCGLWRRLWVDLSWEYEPKEKAGKNG